MKEKMYKIEKHEDYHTRYRFLSLYNGMRGSWTTWENAVEEGEAHQKIVLALAGCKDAELQLISKKNLSILYEKICTAISRLDKIEVSDEKWGTKSRRNRSWISWIKRSKYWKDKCYKSSNITMAQLQLKEHDILKLSFVN